MVGHSLTQLPAGVTRAAKCVAPSNRFPHDWVSSGFLSQKLVWCGWAFSGISLPRLGIFWKFSFISRVLLFRGRLGIVWLFNHKSSGTSVKCFEQARESMQISEKSWFCGQPHFSGDSCSYPASLSFPCCFSLHQGLYWQEKPLKYITAQRRLSKAFYHLTLKLRDHKMFFTTKRQNIILWIVTRICLQPGKNIQVKICLCTEYEKFAGLEKAEGVTLSLSKHQIWTTLCLSKF